jgi:death-on-curing protein
MKIQYLTSAEILRLHYQIIEDFGGSHGVRDESRLGSVTAAPKQVAFGEAQYPDISQKAAVYLRNIIGDHPFSDGNKRTAITACGIFLARNNTTLTATQKELEDFTVQVATDHLSIAEISTWLESHIVVY